MPRRCEKWHPSSPASCRLCWLYENDPEYRARWGGPSLSARPGPPPRPASGGPGTELAALLASLGLPEPPGCACRARARQMDAWGPGGCRERRGEIVAWLAEAYAKTGWLARARAAASAALSGLAFALDWSDPAGSLVDEAIRRATRPAWPLRYDEKNLWPGVPGKRFNASILAYEGGYLLAARNGWAGSEIYLGRLDADFRPAGAPWRLALRREGAGYGAEDPRLFWHDGAVHVAYVGVVGGRKILHTNMMYARLGGDLQVERAFFPRYPQRRSWEKNWSFLSHDGLYAVYSISPHRLLSIGGERAELAHETPNPSAWTGGERRGGASPVRVGDEYWHFAHDRIERAGRRHYRTLLYAFEARPPFRVARAAREPIMVAETHDKPRDQYAFVTFTCGAVRDAAGDWVLSSGVHDRWTRLDRFSHADLESRLEKV